MHLESYRAVRWIRTLNLMLQAVLIVSFFGGLNYLALHYSWRWDLTRTGRQSLSPETRSYLENLKRPVRIVVTLTEDYPDAEVASDLRGLLREYAFASEASRGEGRISVEYLDPYQRPHEAEALGIREANTIFLFSGDKRRAVLPSEIYRLEGGEKREFLGEQVFTAAVLDVTAAERKKIYFLTGHGEFQPDDPGPSRGLSVLRDALRLRNFSTALLDLTHERRVPEDAALVIIAAPDRIEPFAQEELRKYLSGRAAGRVLILLAPRVAHGLTDLLLDWGVMLADNDIVVDSNPRNVTEDGNLRIAAFTAHPITRTLIDNQLPVIVGLARSLRPATAATSGVATMVLAASEESAWGSRHSSAMHLSRFQEGDIRGNPRLGLITVSERVQARSNLPFSVRSGRLIVFGSADLATNSRLSGAPGNQAIVLNAINWAVERDAQLAIPPRPIERFQLSLSQEQLSRLRLSLWFGIPGLVALLGFLVYWTRRS